MSGGGDLKYIFDWAQNADGLVRKQTGRKLSDIVGDLERGYVGNNPRAAPPSHRDKEQRSLSQPRRR